MKSDGSTHLLIQEQQYQFPYHYIPTLDAEGRAQRYRVLNWGFEYLCYQHHIVDKVRSMGPQSVLEVGCGDGVFIGLLGSHVKRRVGADFSERAIGFARAFHPNVDFHVGDAATLNEQFDVVVAIEVLEHVPNEQLTEFLFTLFARAKPGGRVIISVPSLLVPLNKKHFRHYSEKLLRKQVREAYPAARVVGIEHVCHVPNWMRIYDKLTVNRYWMFDISIISSWLWRRLWSKHREADAKTGRHLVGVFAKPM